QAEDGIRDLTVTGVQTCALPIYHLAHDQLAVTQQPVVRDEGGGAPLPAHTGPEGGDTVEEDLLAVHECDPCRRVQPFRQPDARIAAADHHYVAVTHTESPETVGGRECHGGRAAPPSTRMPVSVTLET